MNPEKQAAPVSEISLQRRVEFHETDRVGMLHFSNFFKYMDTAVGEFFRALDLPGPLTRYWGGTQPGEFDWPYAAVSCNFKKPVQFDDLLKIQLWVQHIGNKSLTLGISFRKEDGEVAAGQMTIVCSQGIQGQPKTIPIPPAIRERLSVASGHAAG